jgi:hypothetical protein
MTDTAVFVGIDVSKARLDVAVAKEREAVSEARIMLESAKRTMEETIKATEEHSRRKALDEFLADIRSEERHYVRENKMLFMNKKSLVLQERIFFRNIPLSNWVEHEMVVEENSDLKRLQEQTSIFSAASLPAGFQAAGLNTSDGRLPISKLLDNTTPVRPASRPNSLMPEHAGFGAQ